MSTILFLIGFPFLVALILLVVKDDAARAIIVKVSAALIAAVSVACVVMNFKNGGATFVIPKAETIGYAMMGIEVFFALAIVVIGCSKKRYLAPVFALIQTPLMIWFELKEGHHIEVNHQMYIDQLGMVMILIIGIIGSLIAVYATGYMKDFQKHAVGGDKRPWFFFLIFLFLSAMFGLVMSNNLIWMYFFWEITSLCSFFLIGYNGLFHKEDTEDKVATRNAFRALVLNLLGGLGFAVGIVLLGTQFGTLELDKLLALGAMNPSYVLAPVIFLAFAALTKCAQMPFNSWLLGAMVAPTPVSALLHSSTMVKAGVFLILKLSPVLQGSYAGVMVCWVGGITFLLASLAAISQSNGKRVLAYSTIANLGLIVVCGGIGSPAAVWAGIMLLIFHAITKSLLFLCVGTTEHNIGSRDIEDMDGMFEKMPRLASYMLIGMTGMFLAPFGMLISKWAAMQAFVDSGSIILIMVICFGSAATAFYWTKWMGKLSATVANQENIEANVNPSENFVHLVLTALTVLVCICFPFVSKMVVVPYLTGGINYDMNDILALNDTNMIICCIMVAVLVLLFAFFFGKTKKKVVDIYMAGVNQGDNLTFEDSMFGAKPMTLRNWYMEGYFGDFKMNVIGTITTSVIIVGFVGVVVGMLIGGGM